jgi:hypothetical protein
MFMIDIGAMHIVRINILIIRIMITAAASASADAYVDASIDVKRRVAKACDHGNPSVMR